MDETMEPQDVLMPEPQGAGIPAWCRALVVLLLAACIVLGCMAFRANANTAALEVTASTICLEAMEQIREEIICPNPKLSSALEEFYTITRIHPGTSYAYLAQDLRVLSNPALVSKLTEHQREYISDALNVFCDNERYAEQEDYLYGVHAIINQVAPNPTGM